NSVTTSAGIIPSTVAALIRRQASPRTIVIPPRSMLRDLHVPEDRRGELKDPLDLLAEGRRRKPLAPRHEGHLVEGDLLDLLGELLAPRLIRRTDPVDGELVELGDLRPAEPGGRARARDAEVNGWIDDGGRRPPGVQDVPAATVRRLLASTSDEDFRPVHRLELDPEAHGLEPRACHGSRTFQVRLVGGV